MRDSLGRLVCFHYLVMTLRSDQGNLIMFPGTHIVSYRVFLVARVLGLAIYSRMLNSEVTSDPFIASAQVGPSYVAIR